MAFDCPMMQVKPPTWTPRTWTPQPSPGGWKQREILCGTPWKLKSSPLGKRWLEDDPLLSGMVAFNGRTVKLRGCVYPRRETKTSHEGKSSEGGQPSSNNHGRTEVKRNWCISDNSYP